MHGKLISMKPAALQRKRTHKDVKALDSEQNQIQVLLENNRHPLEIHISDLQDFNI